MEEAIKVSLTCQDIILGSILFNIYIHDSFLNKVVVKSRMDNLNVLDHDFSLTISLYCLATAKNTKAKSSFLLKESYLKSPSFHFVTIVMLVIEIDII